MIVQGPEGPKEEGSLMPEQVNYARNSLSN